MEVLLLYFLFINVLVFIFAGYDKFQARKNNRRIPENTLFLMAFMGGSPSLLTAMLLFRHKTNKIPFIRKLAVILAIQTAFIIFLLDYKK